VSVIAIDLWMLYRFFASDDRGWRLILDADAPGPDPAEAAERSIRVATPLVE
jgi:hypothetical protein